MSGLGYDNSAMVQSVYGLHSSPTTSSSDYEGRDVRQIVLERNQIVDTSNQSNNPYQNNLPIGLQQLNELLFMNDDNTVNGGGTTSPSTVCISPSSSIVYQTNTESELTPPTYQQTVFTSNTTSPNSSPYTYSG
eukprot:TRINITY_DN8373_c0_g1_i1.p1 TRINITY_DN8373_c0_g1~~TRINITY_DN8373_c0_g1_i1.p1  ORF type:complete len:134 (+),score=24.62 TRINITY_DN8373_c0_g1_i1:353-754(+)